MTDQGFVQKAPNLGNQFTNDIWLRGLLAWKLPREIYEQVAPDLTRFGGRVVGEMQEWAWEAETHPPKHVPFDPWGRRIDEIQVSAAWKKMAEIAAEEGIVAIGYERKQAEYSRLYQLAKLYLYHPSSALFSCPLAMTDGAAKILELIGPHDLKDKAFRALTSRNPGQAWTSGQWMTETTGGSDVSATSTVATAKDGQYTLAGLKWFTSAVTSEMALTLARIEGAPFGSKGLSLFYVETHRADGSLNSIQVNRLKDKLGTRALPTAELTLQDTPARLLGEAGQGVKAIATMLNVTRVYNAVCSLAQMRRALALLQSYANQREVFGLNLARQPLFGETFANEQTHFLANLVLVFGVAELLGRVECDVASESERSRLRLLTPLAKLFSGKHAVATVSEVLEGFGGAGYIEDTRLPVLLRDAQVFPIWEGPTNVLCLDLLRVLQKPEVGIHFLAHVTQSLNELQSAATKVFVVQGEALTEQVRSCLARIQKMPPETAQRHARELAFALSELYSGVELLRWADWAVKVEPKLEPNLGDGILAAVERWWSSRPARTFADKSESQASKLWL